MRADLLAQVADVHVEAAVVQGQLATEGQLRQFLFVQRFAGLLEQGFEQAAFGNGKCQFFSSMLTTPRTGLKLRSPSSSWVDTAAGWLRRSTARRRAVSSRGSQGLAR